MRKTAAVLALAALAAGCSLEPVPPGPEPLLTSLPRDLTPAEQHLLSASNGFAWQLFRQVSTAEAGKNVFLSPLSASMALGMTMNGAAGQTFTQMRSTLGFGDASLADINAGYKGLIGLLRGLDHTTTFQLANSIWYRQGFPIEAPFLAATTDWFDATVQGRDFGDPATLTAINQWASGATNGKIPKVLDQISPDEVMFLINAIYFKGAWRERFDPARTQFAPFHLADGTVINTPMMTRGPDTVSYLDTPAFDAIDLPYGNGAFTMTVMLPDQGHTVDELIASMTPESWTTVTAGFHPRSLTIGIPKFRLAYERKLNDDLAALGMTDAFVPGTADFSAMTPQGVFIEFVKQNSFVDVNEEGTEAAAVTTVSVGVTSAPNFFIADRPFVFVIRERLSGTILFVGRILRP